MPSKELPPDLVQRMREAAEKAKGHDHSLYRALSGMKSLDPRPSMGGGSLAQTDSPGLRIREFDVSSNYPGAGVALKRMHEYSPEEALDILQKAVRRHNESRSSDDYDLLEPKAHPIRDDIVAMSREDCISLHRLIYGPDVDQERARWLESLGPGGFGIDRLKRVEAEVKANVVLEGVKEDWHNVLWSSNVLVLGVGENGKLRIVPAIDVF